MTRVILAIAFITARLWAISYKQAVIGSQHDLTVTGGGPVKSAAVDACIFCHAPHNIQPNITPLWDHALSAQSYTTYTSSTYTSGAQTPAAGSSKLCLSCHDGTVAVGLTVTLGTIATSGAMSGTDILGTDLTHSHPLSMTPVDDGSLVTSLFATPPTTKDPTVQLASGKIECTTCHDPHVPNNDPALPMFLVRSNNGSAICLACHDPTRAQPNVLSGWLTGAHAVATNTVPTTTAFGAYGTVGTDSCSSCHRSHNNTTSARLLEGVDGAACSPCHSGSNVSPPLRNVLGEYTKTYSHPTLTVTGVHDPAETVPVNTTRHAACADCHNPHAASPQTGTPVAPSIEADLSGVSGYDTAGAVKPAAKEYQVCLKCHADSTNKPTITSYGRTASRYPGGPMPTGYPIQPPMPADQYNVRLKFLSTIGHNVMGNTIVTTTNTSLRPFMLNVDGTNNTSRPLTTTTLLYCTDCHNSDQARSSNGTGPNGPHGSVYPHLLQMNLFQDTVGGGGGGGGGTSASALCNKCHNVSTIRNESPHDEHSGVGCTTCHDPHGVIGGTPSANRAMMNFDTGVASKSTTYFGYFAGVSGRNGCYTTCHGENHNPRTY